jgi:hypothetical protein
MLYGCGGGFGSVKDVIRTSPISTMPPLAVKGEAVKFVVTKPVFRTVPTMPQNTD